MYYSCGKYSIKNMVYFTPSPITGDEIAGAEKIRQIIGNIPDAFNTTFYLARWWRAYNGDLERIERNMKDLFDHRRILGYDQIETELLQTKLEIAKKTFERFCISKVALHRSANNVCVFFQRMVTNDIEEISKVVPFSYVLHSYFILQEAFTRAQLETEKATGSPAAVASILDLSEVNTTALLNPSSVSAQFVRLIVKIWADYFAETLVPAVYGGKWRDESGYAEEPELVCQKPIKIIPEHYYNPDLLWRKYGFQEVPLKTIGSIKRKQTFEVEKICMKESQILLWDFTVTNDIEFSIVKMEEEKEEQVVWPKITLTSLRVPEQGSIACRQGKYKIRFKNPNRSIIPIKLHYVITLCPDN
uniref:GOLD domain-containing protein n=1 Tax=Setaria digitata TaxID=48799 RepID=A0A915PWZ5_9BILA